MQRLLALADCILGLLGWNGRRNTGDDAMTSVIVEHAARVIGGGLKCILLADEQALPHFDAPLSPDSISGYRGYNLVQALPTALVRDAVWRSLYDRRFALGLDLLVIGGGSIFHGSRMLKRYRGLVDRVRSHNPGARVAALGVSIGPFKTAADRAACADIVTRLDFVGVRDETSAEELERIGYRGRKTTGLDLGVLLDHTVPDPSLRDAAAPRIGIALRGDVLAKRGLEELAAAFGRLLERRRELELSLFVFCGDPRAGDERATTVFARTIGESERVTVHPYSSRPGRVSEEIARCRLLVAMRLHAGVLAYATKTPFLMLAYHPKSLAFADQVGLPDELRCDARTALPDEIVERLEAELAGPLRPRASLALEDGRRSARRHLVFLTEAMSALGAQSADDAPVWVR